MSKFLNNIDTGVKESYSRILLHGDPGVGKSTWAKDAPGALFVDPHGGTDRLDVRRVSEPDGGWSWQSLIDLVDELTKSEHDFNTLVIDELGRWEKLCHRFICKKHGKHSIEDWGWRNGYKLAADEWMHLVHKLDYLREKMGVIMIAHTTRVDHRNPDGDDWHQMAPDVDKTVMALLNRWCDSVFYATFDNRSVRKNAGRSIGLTGPRVLKTTYSATYVAKTREALPPVLPLDYAEYSKCVEAGESDNPEEMLEAILLLTKNMPEAEAKMAATAAKKNSKNPRELSKILNWATEKSNTKEEKNDD